MPTSADALPVTVELPVLWGDLDALGHVNNTRFFRWFEEARIALFERVEIAHRDQPGVGPILARTECDFLAPVTFPDTVTVGAGVSRLGRTSFTMEYAVDMSGGTPAARGSGVVVMLDYAEGRPVPLPPDLAEALGALAI